MRHFLLLGLVLGLLSACGAGDKPAVEQPIQEPGKTEVLPDYKNLLQGYWELPETDGIRPWMQIKGDKVYGELNDNGVGYRLDGNRFIRLLPDGSRVSSHILQIDEKSMTWELEGGFKETWTKTKG